MYNVSGLRRRGRWGRRTAWSCSAWPGGRRTDPSTSSSQFATFRAQPRANKESQREKRTRNTARKKQRTERWTSFRREVKLKCIVCWDLVLSNRYPCKNEGLSKPLGPKGLLYVHVEIYKISSAIYCTLYKKRVC